MKPHKWAEAIKAFADGIPIQAGYVDSYEWFPFVSSSHDFNNPQLQFRVKPEKKSPGEVMLQQMWPHAKWDLDYEQATRDRFNRYAQAVINAYKAGEIDETLPC
jgi:hypothetical protein